MSFSKSRLGSVCYYVSDVDRTEAFWRDAMGIALQREEDDGSGNPWLMGETANGIVLIFFKNEVRAGNSPMIVFEMADGGIDDAVEALADKGVTIVTPVSHAPGGWSAEVEDPDGHTISLYQEESVPRSLR